MKLTNLFGKVIIAILAMGLFLTSCEEDEQENSESTPADITIPIDDNSAFNMKSFITSFDQLFVADNRWRWDFSHDYIDGKAMTSYQNYKIAGELGNNVQTTTHNYNSEGVIISSNRTSNLYSDDIVTFEYNFDLDGFVVKLTKYNQGKLRDIVNLEYNDENQLIKKTHEAIDEDDEEWYETFSYNSDGTVASYMQDDGDKSEYKYSNGNMIEEQATYDEDIYDYIIKYDYDSNNRLIKIYGEDNDWYTEMQYSSDVFTILRYNEDLLYSKDDYQQGFKLIKSYDYQYTDGSFQYCKAQEIDDSEKTEKKEYYEGSVENLQLVGYSVIDSRDENKNDKKTKESVYNASGTKLYYAEFTLSGSDDYWYISETNWFNEGGTLIDESDISEDWVFILVR